MKGFLKLVLMGTLCSCWGGWIVYRTIEPMNAEKAIRASNDLDMCQADRRIDAVTSAMHGSGKAATDRLCTVFIDSEVISCASALRQARKLGQGIQDRANSHLEQITN